MRADLPVGGGGQRFAPFLTSTNLTDFQKRTGLELLDTDSVLEENLPPIQRWLNRLLALPIGIQNVIFDEFLALVKTRVAAAREAGTLDIGVETMAVETTTVLDDIVLRTEPTTQLAQAQLRLFQCQFGDLIVDVRRDTVPHTARHRTAIGKPGVRLSRY